MSKDSSEKLAVLILSCDKNSDLWKSFFHQFHKHWPNCPYKICLGSTTKKYVEDPSVQTVLSGKYVDWSTETRTVLQQISEPYLFILAEDFFISSHIDQEKINTCIDLLKQKESDYIYPFSPFYWNISLNNFYLRNQTEHFGEFEKGEPNNLHLTGFWKKKALLKLIVDGENPWQFEMFGSYRSIFLNKYYFLRNSLFTFVHMVEKGQWLSGGLRYCKEHNVPIEVEKRRVIASKTFFGKIQTLYYVFIICFVPWRVRMKIVNFLRIHLLGY